jgi:hypothetical protein
LNFFQLSALLPKARVFRHGGVLDVGCTSAAANWSRAARRGCNCDAHAAADIGRSSSNGSKDQEQAAPSQARRRRRRVLISYLHQAVDIFVWLSCCFEKKK